MTKNICIAGVTGWAGSALAKAVHQADDLVLGGAIARNSAGKTVAEVLGLDGADVVIAPTVTPETLTGMDVLMEYTKPDIAMHNIMTALDAGVHVVVGTSGLTEEDYRHINAKAVTKNLGVLAVGNFALTVVLLQKFAQMAAKYIPQWEIIDYAHDDKIDAPSGTARELAHRLSQVRSSQLTIPLSDTRGEVEARGTDINGSQIHSIRLPGYNISAEVIFGMPDQKLTIRHDSGASAQPYVEGALLALRKVDSFTGLRRGLDQVLDLD